MENTTYCVKFKAKVQAAGALSLYPGCGPSQNFQPKSKFLVSRPASTGVAAHTSRTGRCRTLGADMEYDSFHVALYPESLRSNVVG